MDPDRALEPAQTGEPIAVFMRLSEVELHELLCLGASRALQRRLITALGLIDADAAADYRRAYQDDELTPTST